MGQRPHVVELMVFGYFNTDIAEPEGNTCEKSIVAVLVDAGLEDIYIHFLPRRIPLVRDSRTLSMIQQGREVRYRIYYILVT